MASIVYSLGVLAIFKYALFAADTARSLFSILGVPVELPYFYIVLPVGISFFTFQSVSYTIDVYKGVVEPTRNFLRFLTFVSLFPQLVAGPIVRYAQLSDQLERIDAKFDPVKFKSGIPIFAFGLFKKVVVADTIASFVDPLWASASELTAAEAWTAALGYTFQLYFDFSGYSDMATGLARFFGLEFPMNFNAPYQALNPTDFWRRWHITLSSFLGDYLYKPLGGNRISRRRTDINLLTVMILGGLWHGANWTFVAWGTFHGLFLVLYKRTQPYWDGSPDRERD